MKSKLGRLLSLLGLLPQIALAAHVNDRPIYSTDIVTKSGSSIFRFPTALPGASTACMINADSEMTSSAVTATELSYLSGVTGLVQAQLNGKQSTLTLGNLTDVGTDGISIGNSTNAVIGTGTTISQQVATDVQNGYTSAADHASTVRKANNLTDLASTTTAFNNISPMIQGGDMIYGGLSGAGTRLPNGANSQVLKSNGGFNAPSWLTFTPSNTVSTLVQRDGSGNFLAGTITASLTGHASLDAATANNLTDLASTTTAFNNISPMSFAGDIIYGGASGAGTALHNGVSGQVLTSGGGAAAPSWSTPVAGLTQVTLTPANGFTSTGLGSTVSPLVLGTTLGGMIKGNSTSLLTAIAGVDYVLPTGNISGTAANISAISNSTLAVLSGLTSAPLLGQVGTITSGIWNAGIIPTQYGGTSVGSVTTTPTANVWAGWDANKGFSANYLVPGFTSIVSSGATTTLLASSTQIQNFTGSSAQTVTMPVVTTLFNGQTYAVINNTSNTITVQSSGGNLIQSIAPGTSITLEVVNTLGGTGTASWFWLYDPLTASAIIPVVNGGTGFSTVSIVPAASAWAGWDANKNFSTNSLIEGFLNVVNSGATTTLLVNSPELINFTGATTQNVSLPVVSGLSNGQRYTMVNNSNSNVTVMSSGGSTVQVVLPGTSVNLYLVNNLGGTGVSPWFVLYDPLSAGGIAPVSSGGTGFSTVSILPIANGWAGWDSNKNLSTNSLIDGYTSWVTAALTSNITAASTKELQLTGATTQTVVLPVVTTLTQGQQFYIVNNSTGVVTVQTSGLNTIQAMATNTYLLVTVANTLGGTGTASWGWQYGPVQSVVTTAPTATTYAGWDANKNLSGSNLLPGYTTTATTGGTLTLTVGSTNQQYFTGALGHNVTLPVATTLVNGYQFKIANDSTGQVKVQTSGLNQIEMMASNSVLVVTCINTAGGTGTASWSWEYYPNQNSALALLNPMTTAGDLIYGGAAGSPTRLGTGIFGQFLMAQGGSSAPIWITGTNQNTASTLVQRDASGNFVAGTITASLTGHASLDAQTTNNLTDLGNTTTAFKNISPMIQGGDLIYGGATGTPTRLPNGNNTQVLQSGGGFNAPTWLTATSSNTTSTLVQRDGSGNFSAGTITASLTGAASLNPLKSNNLSDMGSTTTAFNNIAPFAVGGDLIYGISAGSVGVLRNGTSGQFLKSNGGTAAPSWTSSSITTVNPTVQKFTPGSGTYTTPTSPSPIYIEFIAVGGGGKGGGAGAGSTNGAAGGDTTFGPSTAGGGQGGGAGAGNGPGGTGGTATLGAGPIGLAIPGAVGGGGGYYTGTGGIANGAPGASAPIFGGAGTPGYASAGGAGVANTGGGGAGGSQTAGTSIQVGGGGGSAGVVWAKINSPSATYSYSVGAGGSSGGAAGTSGAAGGNGGDGYLIVIEYYQ